MSSEEEVSQQIFGSSISAMPETLQKQKGTQLKLKKDKRRLALLPEEIAEIKILAAATPQKKRTILQTQENPLAQERTLEIPSKGSISGITIITPKMGEKE